MEQSSTRIADLPENITMGMTHQTPQQTIHHDMNASGQYMQMNVHPNPYGQAAPQIGAIPPPQQTHTYNLGATPPPQQTHAYNLGAIEHPLPNRDIPMDTVQYQQDPQIVPNFLPDQEKEKKYVLPEKEKKKKKKAKPEWNMEEMMAEFQQPIIIVVLFLIFQAPSINVLIAKHLAFLHLFGEDGDLNTNGVLFKSVLFGGMYILLCRFLAYVDQ